MDLKDSKAVEEAKHEVSGLQRIESVIPGLSWFASEYSFTEAIVRGFRSGFLKSKDYIQLQNAETLEEFKLALSDTDYCNVLSGVAKLTPDIIYKKCEDKFLQEFAYVQAQATGALATFLEFITYEDLITNISFVITSLIRGADPESLLSKCLPLGRSAHLRSIMTFENYEGSDGLVELYRNVLVDTPVAPYFERYFNSELRSEAPSREIQRVYSEVEIDIITNMLQKLWLEDFYDLCKSFGGDTWLFMKPVLEFEADRRAIAITINSFGTSLNEVNNRDSERKSLYCNFGSLFPDATQFAFSRVGDHNSLAMALEPYPMYADLLRQSQDGSKSFTDLLYQHEVSLMISAFECQSHFAGFYAFVKLKKQELRNIKWILSCITQKRRDKRDLERWIKTF